MDKVMHELGNTLSDQDVNTVASQHFDAQQVKKKFESSAVCSCVKIWCTVIPLHSQRYYLTTGISGDSVSEFSVYRFRFCLAYLVKIFCVLQSCFSPVKFLSVWMFSPLNRCWRTSGPVSWSKLLASRSRSTRSGSLNCTRTCRNPTTAAK